MKPVLPVIPGSNLPEVVYAQDQAEYNPLPCYKMLDGTVITRWRCSWDERFRVFWSGNIYLEQMTFNQPLQPIRLDTRIPLVENAPVVATI